MAVDVRKIDSWGELNKIAYEFKTENWIFRGVEVEAYELIPKIGRCDTRKNMQGTKIGYSADVEARAIERFKREARPLLSIEPKSELDWLSIAQHHGMPTRLLDWSESPLVAAYFALKPAGIVRGERKDAAIYGIPLLQTVKSDKELSETADDVVAYYPQHLTPRITAQRGLFTCHKQPDHAYAPSCFIKWTIPSDKCFELKLAINKSGINEASMFPDLDGLSRYVEWLYKWDLL